MPVWLNSNVYNSFNNNRRKYPKTRSTSGLIVSKRIIASSSLHYTRCLWAHVIWSRVVLMRLAKACQTVSFFVIMKWRKWTCDDALNFKCNFSHQFTARKLSLINNQLFKARVCKWRFFFVIRRTCMNLMGFNEIIRCRFTYYNENGAIDLSVVWFDKTICF